MPGITFAKLAAPALKTLPDGMHADGGNLSLLVRGDSRFWIFRYRLRGRRRDLSLGPLHTISLAAARKLAAEARAMVKGGVCPIEARRAEQSAQRQVEAWTFKRCAQAYISARRAEWRNDKSLTAWESTLATYAYPEIGELPVSAVDTARVMRVLSPLWAGEGARTETASRLRGRIEADMGVELDRKGVWRDGFGGEIENFGLPEDLMLWGEARRLFVVVTDDIYGDLTGFEMCLDAVKLYSD